MKMYRDDCAGCHGDYGRPSEWGSQDFYPRVPQFALEPPHNPDWQLFWIVKHGVRYSGMGAWDGQVPDSMIWQVVAFLSRLDSLPPSVDVAWRKARP
jgi:thiosulfate dehydrogenase